jgi:F-type H+-transporting ATPase subunit b
VLAIARKTLAELAGTSLEARMAEVFMRRLRELGDSERAGLAAVAAQDIVTVRSAFELPQPQRTAIEETLKAVLGISDPARFEIVPNLVSGIELMLHGQKVAWSISDHLAALEKELAELLKAQRDNG